MKKLATIGNVSGGGNKWVAFKDWTQELQGAGRDPAGVYPVTHLLAPNRYPQGGLVFWDEVLDKGVKRTVQPQDWNALLGALEATLGRPIKGKALWVEITEEGEINLLVDDSATAIYIPTTWGWEMA